MKTLATAVTLLLAAAPASAQTFLAPDSTNREIQQKLALDTTSPREQKLCFRAQGCPNCDTIVLLEFSMGKSSENCGEGPFASGEFGLLQNVSPAYGVGATVFYGGDDCGGRFGFHGRLRRWLVPQVGLDIAPGIVLTGEQDGFRKFPAFSGQVALDLFGLVAPMYQLEMQRSSAGTRWDSIVGLRTESYAAPVVVVALTILAGISMSSTSYGW